MSQDCPTNTKPSSREPLKLDLNEHSEGSPAWVFRALGQLPEEAIWQYTDRQTLERSLARHFGLCPEQVLATNGGDEAIHYFLACQNPDTPVILPLPTFGFYEEQVGTWPVRPISVPALPNLQVNLDQLYESVSTHANARVILVRPNNPTGESIPRHALIELLGLAKDRGSTLLLDEAYAEFADEDSVDLLNRFPNLLILRTFSKAHGLAGLRIGYLLGSPESLGNIRERALPYNISSISLFLAMRALEEEALSETKQYRDGVVGNRNRLFQLLENWGLPVSASQANFLCLRLGERRARFVHQVLARRGIRVRHFQRSYLAGCLRISIPAGDSPLVEALAEAFRPELVCLDVDGCLIDVRESFDAVVMETVAAFSGQSVDRRSIHALRAESGFNDDIDLAFELLARAGVSADRAEVAAHFRGLYFGSQTRPGLYRNEKPLIESQLLERLGREHAAVLVTGRDRREAALGLELLALPPDFPCITIDDVASGKPDPEGILLAARRKGARRIWMVGDNVDDMVAAQGADAVPIGIGTTNREALQRAGAAVVLEHIDQLADLLPPLSLSVNV